MPAKLELLLDYLGGRADAETAEMFRRELADPESDTNLFIRGFSGAAGNPLRIAGMPSLQTLDCKMVDEEIDALAAGMVRVEYPAAFDESAAVEQPGPGATFPRPGSLHRAPLHRTRLSAAALAAACLLVGLGYLIASSLATSGTGVLVATATPVFTPGRGGAENLAVEIHSNLPGFVSLVSLAPGRRPVVRPFLGGQEIRNVPGRPTSSGPLPSDTASVVFTITETPASERISEALVGHEFSPARPGELEAFLRAALETRGYRRLAVGTRSVPKP